MAVTTPTEGMTGSKNQQGKPPGSVTWENRVEDEIEKEEEKEVFQGKKQPQ